MAWSTQRLRRDGSVHVKPSPQHFPSTPLTGIRRWVGRNDSPSLNHHLMSAYYEPIRRYLKGSRWFASRIAARRESAKSMARYATGLGEGGGDEDLNELVNGFFTHLLDKRDFIDRWLVSGRRLGQYLRGALWLYVTGLMRDERRELECTEELIEADAKDDPPSSRSTRPSSATSSPRPWTRRGRSASAEGSASTGTCWCSTS